jgi:hypothetical protein
MPRTEYVETFKWAPDLNVISKEFWADEAVVAYKVNDMFQFQEIARIAKQELGPTCAPLQWNIPLGRSLRCLPVIADFAGQK